MEVGRTSFRSNRNKREPLPLAMALSFNDKGVHPDCPNVSNPYHKCDRHCIDKIPSGKDFLNAIRSDGDRELEKISVKKGVNPKCPHASNRYHKCAEYCLDKVSEKRPAAGEQRPGMNPNVEKKDVFTTERGVKPVCINASNPYHACDERCFQTVPEKDQLGQSMRLQGLKKVEKVLSTKNKSDAKPKENETIVAVEQRANLEHKNASNPSYECLEYCSESVLNRDRHEQVIRLKSKKEGNKFMNNRHRTEFDPRCKYASKPHHECTEFCFRNTPERNLDEGENSEGVFMETDKYVHSSRKHTSNPNNKVTEYDCKDKDTSEKEHPEADQGVNLECKSVLNPDHVRSEYCFQSATEKEQHEQEKPKGVSFEIDKSSSLPNRKHASNPYHEVIEYCFDDNPEKKNLSGAMKPTEERLIVTAEPGVNLVCKYESNPYHKCTEYCIQNLHIKDQSGKALMKVKENKVDDSLEVVNPQCKHTSNPYHVCAEYCSQSVSNGHQPGKAIMKSKEEKEVVASPRVPSFDCKFTSNPYHVCGEYCLENVLEKDPPRQTIKKLKEEELEVLPSERRVSPECKFASNPYHVCAEYCFQKALETEQRVQGMKLKSLKELKNLVSNKKITSGHDQCEYASNPYHKCAEYCFNNNMHVSQIPDGVVKVNERKKEKSYAPRRDDNPKYKNASNSLQCAEYFPEEISPKNEAVEGSTATVKEKKRNSSKEHKRNDPSVEKISLNSKYTDGTKDMQMQSEKVVDMNPKELSDMPPVDAHDLFHEWSEYCSQTKADEDETVKQEKKAGMREFATRNGKGNGFPKDYDSATITIEKVQATGSFRPISLLFLLGFLLALLHWAQVIHSLVMSSEKNEEAERMKHERRLVDPNCKKPSDAYHKCSY